MIEEILTVIFGICVFLLVLIESFRLIADFLISRGLL